MNTNVKIGIPGTPPETRQPYFPPASGPMPTPGAPVPDMPESKAKGKTLTLQQRIFLMPIFMVLVVIVTGVLLIQSLRLEASNIQTARQAAEFAIQLSELQLDTLAVTSIMDTFSITRPTEDTQREMNRRLSLLNDRLTTLQATSFGISDPKIAENEQILADLVQAGLDMRDLSNQLYLLALQNRWGSALRLRQTEMAKVQERLSADLRQLQDNLRSDLSGQVIEVERQQNLLRIYMLLTVLGALGVATMMIVFSRRTVILPIQQLIGTVQRITQGDFSSFAPLPRQDEIGDLSHAMALMTDWLRDSYTTLAKRVTERTGELEERTVQLQVAGQVARDIAAMHDLEMLLFQAVNLIRERFGFYHASIFLNDIQNEYTVLRAATGEAGNVMLQRGHRLKIGEMGLVGHAARSGEVRMAVDVERDPQHRKHPLLPETRSEVALPLRASGKVIGVLDVQSRQVAAFGETNLAVLQVMADQLAIAIQNARLLAETQASLQELQAVYGRASQEAWLQFMQGRQTLGYDFDGIHMTPLQGGAHTERRSHAERGNERGGGEGEGRAPLSIPLRVRGMEIGALDVWPQESELDEGQIYLLASISSRLSQILESARLYEEAQGRAANEQTLNQLVAAVARALDTERVLQTAVQQLGQLPGVSQAVVFVGGEDEPGA